MSQLRTPYVIPLSSGKGWLSARHNRFLSFSLSLWPSITAESVVADWRTDDDEDDDDDDDEDDDDEDDEEEDEEEDDEDEEEDDEEDDDEEEDDDDEDDDDKVDWGTLSLSLSRPSRGYPSSFPFILSGFRKYIPTSKL